LRGMASSTVIACFIAAPSGVRGVPGP